VFSGSWKRKAGVSLNIFGEFVSNHPCSRLRRENL
jgi:hypothetical protein